MTPSEAMLRRCYGDVAGKATLARNILAPVAGKVSGHPSELNRRCLFARGLSFSTETREVRDRFSKYGQIEAIAICGRLGVAVVVYWNAMNWEVATLDSDSFVPPLYLGPALILAEAQDIKVAFYPWVEPPKSDEDVPIMETFHKLYGDQRGRPTERITEFVVSEESLRDGPRLGADGHPRYYGTSYSYWRTSDHEHFVMSDSSRRAADLDDPHKKPRRKYPFFFLDKKQ